VIRTRLCHIWAQGDDAKFKDLKKKVKNADGIEKYVHGGPTVMAGYWRTLNQSPEFEPDGLYLGPNDTAYVHKVGELIVNISHWYSQKKK
jgi:hypothetical protein